MASRHAVVIILTSAIYGVASTSNAAEGELQLTPASNDVANTASLQRGARNFMNYCSGCHSANYVRYNTVAADLGLTEDQLIDNLMFNAETPHDTIERTMAAEDAERWFGQSPPDLSIIPSSRGIDYIFNFLQGFYVDPDSPTGVDNIVLPGTGMPHVLWELQGYQRAVFSEQIRDGEAGPERVFERFETVIPGTMSPEEFQDFVRDTVNFLDYVSEPIQLKRQVIGVWVLLFLTVFLIISLMLKKQIWKDVS